MTGVAIIASMVPRSHSRATTSDVSSVPTSVMTMAIEPGTRKIAARQLGIEPEALLDRDRRQPFAMLSDRRSAAQVATMPCA